MTDSVSAEISAQLARARAVIERHLESTLLAEYLYGSAVDGGLKPYSDIDLLVAVSERPVESARRALLLDLLEVSAPPGRRECARALEVTVVVRDDVVPWRYPAVRALQFGEWLREDILAGNIAPAVADPDLAILLTQARHKSIALLGPPAGCFFDPVPDSDIYRALSDTLALWVSPQDWSGDERNVLLTLARIWYSAETRTIVPKDVAARWAIDRLSARYQPVLVDARRAYLGHGQDDLASRESEVAEFVRFVKGEIVKALATKV